MKHAEDSFQILCADYLDLKGLLWCHVPNGGSRNLLEAKRLKRMGTKRGVPDIIIFNSPHVFTDQDTYKFKGTAIELKAGKNKPTAHQTDFLEKLQNNGWLVYVIYHFDEFQSLVNELYPNIVVTL